MKLELLGRRITFNVVLLALVSLPTGTTQATSSGETAASAGCDSPTALCLSNGRFAVEAAWKTSDGSEGIGHPVPLVADSGYFWFFDPNNVELAVKSLNGCGINGHYWLFAGGLTDVEVTLTVTDTVSGEIRTYANPLGQAFQPITDTAAFPTCSDVDAALSTRNPEEPPERFFATAPMKTSAARSLDVGCVPSGTALCVKGRFQIEATWQTASGATGSGYAVPLTSEAGYLWFFQPSNLELIIKTLDACSIGGGQWFFAAGLTDVGVELTITDTSTGERRIYSNPLGTPFIPVLDTSAFSFCPTPTPTPTATPTPTPRRVGYQPKIFDVRLETENCLNPRIVPKEISIYHTDTVRWTAGDCGHRIVSDQANNPWDSGTMQPGSTYERRRFSTNTNPEITVPYSCTTHGETGTIFVRWNPRYPML